MQSVFKLLYFFFISFILLFFYIISSSNFYLFIFLILNFLTILLKHILQYNSINNEFILFDIVLLNGNLMLLNHSYIFDLIIFFIFATIYFFLPSVSLLYFFPLHVYMMLIFIAIDYYFYKDNVFFSYSHYIVIILIPLLYYYEQYLILYLLRVILFSLFLFHLQDFNQALLSINQILGFFIFAYSIPFQLKRWKRNEFIQKIFIIILELLSLYLLTFYLKHKDLFIMVVILYMFYDILFNVYRIYRIKIL